MPRLIYSAMASLDGYIEDAQGSFAWAAPDEEVHRFVNDLERDVGTHLLGRRMYETLVYWERPPSLDDQPAFVQDFARIWQSADKVVYSRTLQAPGSARTRIEREFDPAAVRALKEQADRDLGVGGPKLAAVAFGHGLVDELQLFVVPVIVGGGKRALPDGICAGVELVDERRFRNGTLFLRYRTS